MSRPKANDAGYPLSTPISAYISITVNRCAPQSGSALEPCNPETGQISPMRFSMESGTMNGMCAQRYLSDSSSILFQESSSSSGRLVGPFIAIMRSRSDMPGAETLPCESTEVPSYAVILADIDFRAAWYSDGAVSTGSSVHSKADCICG